MERNARLEKGLHEALRIIENGEPFIEHWSDEGDAENGPSGGSFVGYRDGPIEVILTQNASVLIGDAEGSEPWMGVIHSSYFINERSYVGLGAMIQQHLLNLKSNIERNGLEFAKTGKRPQDAQRR